MRASLFVASIDWVGMNALAKEVATDYESVIARYKDMVYGIALSHTRNRSDAEDVFQEVFLVYHKKQPRFESSERQKAWLIVTTINCARQITTSSWQKKVVLIREQLEDRDANEQIRFRTDEQDTVFLALQELPARYKTVLYLHYFEDLSVTQISKTLGIEVGTVKVQLFRGRALMRERLKGEYFNE